MVLAFSRDSFASDNVHCSKFSENVQLLTICWINVVWSVNSYFTFVWSKSRVRPIYYRYRPIYRYRGIYRYRPIMYRYRYRYRPINFSISVASIIKLNIPQYFPFHKIHHIGIGQYDISVSVLVLADKKIFIGDLSADMEKGLLVGPYIIERVKMWLWFFF